MTAQGRQTRAPAAAALLLAALAAAACRPAAIDRPVARRQTVSGVPGQQMPSVPTADVPAFPASAAAVAAARAWPTALRALPATAPSAPAAPNAVRSVMPPPGPLAVTPGQDQAPELAATPPPPTAAPGAERVVLGGARHVWQKWNNCGPSSLVMAMSVLGRDRDQLAMAAVLKPDREDTNVTPEELAAAARGEGLGALVRYGGNRDLARSLVRAAVPVVAEQWIDVEGRGEMGHYRVVTGFDDAEAAFVVQDSYYGADRRYGYDEFERMWRPFLGAYLVVYDPAQEAAVMEALGPDRDEAAMWARVAADTAGRASAAPGDAWAQYAQGEAMSRVGRHSDAVAAFDRAVAIGLPFRAFWYQFGFYRSLSALGLHDRVIAQADATLAGMKGENLEESRYWRGMALRALGREEEARADFQAALRYNPLFTPAAEALAAGP